MSSESNVEIAVDHHWSGKRLDLFASAQLPAYSREQIKKWILAGDILINGQLKKPSDKVTLGQAVTICISPPVLDTPAEPQNIPLSILYEDHHLLVIDKPAGLIVHPGNGNANNTLMNGLLFRYPESASLPRAGIVHRLDKETTGLMVVAKTLESYTDLVRQLKDKRVTRIYQALVFGQVKSAGIVNAPIGRHRTDRVKMAINESGKEAVTHYRPIAYYGYPGRPTQFTLLECQLETGRTHQIRVHMQSIGYPLVGDPTYGLKRPVQIEVVDSFPRQALHATTLTLKNLDREELQWISELSQDFLLLLNNLDKQQ